MLKIPELKLDEEESKELARAVKNVTELYDVPLMDAKTEAWVALGIVAVKLYGPRIVVAKMTTRRKEAPKPVNVTPVQPIDFTRGSAGVM